MNTQITRWLGLLGLVLLTSLVGSAQGLHGDWAGTLSLPMGKLKLVLHIDLQGEKPSITMDSPQQGAYGLRTQIERLEEKSLRISIAQLMLSYEAELRASDSLVGTFTQGGLRLPLSLARQQSKSTPTQSAQPKNAEELTFLSADGKTKIAGTLSTALSGERKTAVVMIAGSGRMNRDEEVWGHRPFAVLSDSLTKAGYATLRYDKRGIGQSEGQFESATMDDFISDAEGAVLYLKSLGYKRIVLLGHSEGGIISARIARLRPKDIAAILLLNAPVKPLDEGLIEQNEVQAKALGLPAAELERIARINRELYKLSADASISDEVLSKRIQECLELILPASLQGEQRQQVKARMVAEMLLPSVRTMLRCKPLEDLRQVRCPILAVQSELDTQVLPSNIELLRQTIPTAQIRRVPATNHLLQPAQTGLPTEYATIEQTLAPEAWRAIAELLAGLY